MIELPPLIEIEPDSELRFKGPYNTPVTTEIKLKNVSGQKVCFKVKTTAPKQYTVRPNCGLIDAGQTVPVTVILQPINTESKEKMKHKFLVQTMLMTQTSADSVEQLWRDAPTEKVCDVMVRCVFDPPLELTDLRKRSKSQVKEKVEEVAKGELQDLLKENDRLKVETLRLRKMMIGSSTSNYLQTSPSSGCGTSVGLVMIIAVIGLVVGMMIGKLVL